MAVTTPKANDMIPITEKQMQFCEKHGIEYQVCYAVSAEVADFFKALAPDAPHVAMAPVKRVKRRKPKVETFKFTTAAEGILRNVGGTAGRIARSCLQYAIDHGTDRTVTREELRALVAMKGASTAQFNSAAGYMLTLGAAVDATERSV